MTTITHPIALLDQHQAAVRAAQRIVYANATPPVARMSHDAARWLLEQAATVTKWRLDPNTPRCPHLGTNPEVMHAMAWTPRRLVCPRCLPTLRPDPDEDSTCDRCRTPVDHIVPAMIPFGPVIFGFGLCRPCLYGTHHHGGTHQ